ncbi:recombinase family protein [Rhodovulum sulfidophilum]|uniref:recombinase family protein n=1 Tax=Rhodovulum sulfidophilum TaxID=35806 RepID=UPI001F43466D|nr:recombinase family protein [Rhodovulum sulfidophilum]
MQPEQTFDRLDDGSEAELDGSGEITEFRAAQYVRMSTEHQQYSTHNQSDKIRKYAEKRDIEIMKIYVFHPG